MKYLRLLLDALGCVFLVLTIDMIYIAWFDRQQKKEAEWIEQLITDRFDAMGFTHYWDDKSARLDSLLVGEKNEPIPTKRKTSR